MRCNMYKEELKDQIIDEVRKMRQLQKDYFLSRDREILAASKASESRVDKLLKELETPNLFE